MSNFNFAELILSLFRFLKVLLCIITLMDCLPGQGTSRRQTPSPWVESPGIVPFDSAQGEQERFFMPSGDEACCSDRYCGQNYLAWQDNNKYQY